MDDLSQQQKKKFESIVTISMKLIYVEMPLV